MKENQLYIVHAAEYTDMTFETAVSSTSETHGPFDSYQEAYKVWKAIAQKWVDHCTHKAEIRPVQ